MLIHKLLVRRASLFGLAWLLVLPIVGCGSSGEPDGLVDNDAALDVSAQPSDASPRGDADAFAGPSADAGAGPSADAGAGPSADAGVKRDAMPDADASHPDCTDDNGCPLGTLCASGKCAPGCTAAHGCEASNVCCAGQCRDLSSDPGNCGACEQACSKNNVTAPTCTAGVCSGTCALGFADCDHSLLDDGCETEVASDPANCGGCGTLCSAQNITPACSKGKCDGACTTGFADCNANKQTDGCETSTQNDAASCGACGVACSSSHLTSVACAAGTCQGACAAGWMDCKGTLQSDGCETDVAGDPRNCGACGMTCSANHVPSPACASGQCDGACASGWADCNGNRAVDGCEQNTSNDPANCGACGAVCANTCFQGGCVCRLGLPDAPLLPTRSAPETIAAADFDGDGRLDLAAGAMQPAPGGGYSLRVFLNQGGAFFTAKDYTTDSGAMALVAADINGDGHPDLATAEYNAGAVDVLINDGHGGFGAATKYVVGNQPVDLALVNGQLIIVDEYSNSLRTLGGGGLGAGIPTGSEPAAIAAGDLDGDGVQDMAVANLGSNTVSVYASRSGNARIDYPTGTAPLAVAIADLDGDGASELLVGEGGTSSLRVFANPGNGKFTTSATYPSSGRPRRIATADLNEDGHPDVVTSNDYLGTALTVFLNQGNGTLGAAMGHGASSAPPANTGLALGDFQRRGHIDIATAGDIVSAVYVFLGVGTGQFIRPPTVETGADSVAVAVGDVNGDGALDLVGANGDGQSISVILSAGGRTFQPRVDVPLSTSPQALALADFDADGLLDVVTANAASGGISVLLNTKGKSGTFGAPVRYLGSLAFGTILKSAATGDVDGDGDIDVVAANYNDSIAVFFNDGHGGFATEVSVGTGTGEEPSDVALVDLNGDNMLDMAVAGRNIVVLLNSGGGTFGSPTAYPVSGYVQSIAAADLDGDGRVDLVGVGNVSGGTAGFVDVLFNGASGFSPATSYPMTELPGHILVSDVDHDGRLDVVASSQNDDSGVVSVFLNTGGGALAARLDYSTPFGAQGLAARDLDGDGHTDVVATIDYNGASGMYLLYGSCL